MIIVLDTGRSLNSAGNFGTGGWSPVPGNVIDGDRVVQQVVDWVGGTGAKPATGKYIGEDGLVDDIASAVDVRGQVGAGLPGIDGWTPLTALVIDGARRVQRVVDWFGGQGSKPDIGMYVGPNGFVSLPAQATDVRGSPGDADPEVIRQKLETLENANRLPVEAVEGAPRASADAFGRNAVLDIDGHVVNVANAPRNYLIKEGIDIFNAANGAAAGVGINTAGSVPAGWLEMDKGFTFAGVEGQLMIYAGQWGTWATFAMPNAGVRVRDLGKIILACTLEKTQSTNVAIRLCKNSNGDLTTNYRSYTWQPDQIKPGPNYLATHAEEDGTTSPAGATWSVNGGMSLDDVVAFVAIYFTTSQLDYGVNPLGVSRLYYGEETQPFFMFGADDFSDITKYTLALPVYKTYGAYGYVAGDADMLGAYSKVGDAYFFTPTSSLTNHVLPLQNEGWDIVPQGVGHPAYALNLTNTLRLSGDIDISKQIFNAAKLKMENGFAYPVSSSSSRTNAILRAKGFLWGRSAIGDGLIHTKWGTDNQMATGSFDAGNKTRTYLINKVRRAKRYGCIVRGYVHGYIPGGDGITTTGNVLKMFVNDLDAMFAECVAQGIPIVKPSQYYPGLTQDHWLSNPVQPRAFALDGNYSTNPIMTRYASRRLSTVLEKDLVQGAPFTEGLRVGEEVVLTITRKAGLAATTTNITWDAIYVFANAFVQPVPTTDDGKRTVVRFAWDGLKLRQVGPANSWA